MAWKLLGHHAIALWPQLGSDLIGHGLLTVWLETLLLWMLFVVGFGSSGALEVRGLLCRSSRSVLGVVVSRTHQLFDSLFDLKVGLKCC
jgi:hypothetical protein